MEDGLKRWGRRGGSEEEQNKVERGAQRNHLLLSSFPGWHKGNLPQQKCYLVSVFNQNYCQGVSTDPAGIVILSDG